MKCIDGVAADTVNGFFTDNLFLRPGPVRPRDVAKVMHGSAHSKIAAHRTALAKYRHHVLGEPLPSLDHLVKIASDLDGAWWSPIL
jgi:hypothetical protein